MRETHKNFQIRNIRDDIQESKNELLDYVAKFIASSASVKFSNDFFVAFELK